MKLVDPTLMATLDTLPDRIALLGRDGAVLAGNRAWITFETANPDAGFRSSEMAQQIGRLLSGEVAHLESEAPANSSAESRWFRLVVRPVDAGEDVAAVATYTDISSERITERALVEARAVAEQDRIRLDAILEAIPVGAWIADTSGQITHRNRAAARVWGGEAPLASNDDGYAVYRGWWADTGVPLAAGDWALSRTVNTGETVADQLTEIQRFDGTKGYLLSTSAPIRDRDGAITGSIAISVDVSERQAAVRERETLLDSLELERSRLAEIFEQATSFFAVLRGADYVFERVNPAYRRLIGYRDVVGLPLLEALPELEGHGFIEWLDRVVATGESFIGKHVPVQLALTPGAPLETRYVDFVYQRLIETADGPALVVHGVDVTEQVLATEALRHSEARLRDQFAKLPGPTLLWEERGSDFVLLDANEAAYETFMLLSPAALGKTSLEITPDGDLDEDRRMALRENVVVRRSLDFDVGPPIGIRSFDVTIGPQQPNRVLVHWVDTTERRALEAQLRQSQKLEAVGQLAGGIAHDFNNLLTVIIAYAAMLLEVLSPADENRLAIVEIEHAARRAADLTRQLLTFSRKELVATQLLDLNASVRDVERLIPRLIGSDVRLEVSLGNGPYPVVAGSGQVGQMLMNIVINANDALPNGGTIRIETAQVHLDEAFIRRHPDAHVGDHIRLCVADTGTGMSEEIRAHAFEPFFTTKGPGKGTGLGLSVVYGIVQQWNGSVDISSSPDNGTSIAIYLPVANVSQEEMYALEVRAFSDVDGAPAVRNSLLESEPVATTILLVDDDDAVRNVVCRVLTQAGYVVLEAASGIDALRLLDENERAIDVVLSDMVMPGMGGRDLAYEVRVRYPTAMLVLMSGYTHEILPADDPLRGETLFLQKPFTPGAVRTAISDALASRRALAESESAASGTQRGVSTDRQALDALVNGIDAIVWEADAQTGRYHYVSRRAQSLLGYPREAWHQDGFWSSIVHPDDRERVVAGRRIASGTLDCSTTDYRLVTADGGTVWIRDVVCVVSRDRDTRPRLGGVMFDVTVSKEAMDDLIRAKESAERSDTAKSEFLKLVSHELHTPLNSIIGFANILRKNRNSNLTDKDLSYLDRIAANGQQLLAIVRNVLDVTKMQAGTLEVQSVPVSVSSLVAETVRDLEGAAHLKQIDIHAVASDGLYDITADPMRLRQVLTNLIGNAIKYTDEGSVVVRVLAAADGVTPSSIEISDTGQGIAPDRLEAIFTAFYQEESFTQRRQVGTGMGLGIARGLCERMGFRLTITSELAKGTTCVVWLAG